MLIGIVANTDVIIKAGLRAGDNGTGDGTRRVGVLVEQDGRKYLLRYTLMPGQRLALVHPPSQPQPQKEEQPA
jgi:hypothetical protein